MKHLSEIVRELCWNSSTDDAFQYLVKDRNLKTNYEEIELVKSIIGPHIDLAYYPNPYLDKEIDMNEFVGCLEEMIWETYEKKLTELQLTESE